MANHEPQLNALLQDALAHHRVGRLAQAAAGYERVLAQDPGRADALHLLGVTAAQSKDFVRAITFIGRAIAIEPANAEFHHNLCVALNEAGRFEEAVAVGRRAVELKPNYADAHSTLGSTLRELGKVDEAIACYKHAIALMPQSAEIHRRLGTALRHQGRHVEAIAEFHAALALDPKHAASRSGLGIAFKELGRIDEAVESQRRAIADKPDLIEAHLNLANALADRGELDASIAAYERIIERKPDYADARMNFGIALLLRGDFARGWEEYEWRARGPNPLLPSRKFRQPEWDGGSIQGRTILLHAEQGLGDTLHFARYVPLVASLAGRVIFECQPSLATLFRGTLGEHVLVGAGEPLPEFDVHCTLLSLPRIMQTTQASIPRGVPYVRANESSVQAWRERLAGVRGTFKVGLAWAGSHTHARDRLRSMPLAALAPLAQVPGVSFHSLQKGAAVAQAAGLPAAFEVINHSESLRDFSDTAGLVENLDLVITVDTSLAHLAGAMGKPAWTMLAFSPDWRWQLSRADSPWYPSMRLFRQPRPCDWAPVVAQIVSELRRSVGG